MPTRPCKWCSITPDVALVTAGDPRRRTGGNLYDQRMLAALRRAGLRVTTVVLRDRRDGARLGSVQAPVVLVDTIAAALAIPQLAGLRARGCDIIALAHMRQGAVPLARRTDRVIAVSRALADELVSGGIERRRIVVIPPGRERLERARASRDRTILCVANWTPAKGIHTLVAAVRPLRDVTLDLVGDMPDAAYAVRVRRAIAVGRLGARVRVHGTLGRAALGRRYALASIFVLPSVREGYPIVLVEALAHGLPIVAADIPAVREVTGGAAVLVTPGRAAPLAAALRELVADDHLREDLGRRARIRARSLPTWAESEARFLGAMRTRSG